MLILSEKNTVLDLDVINTETYYSVLSFRDYKNPDFQCEPLSRIEFIESSAVTLQIGSYNLVMPFVWNILVTDFDNLECIPLIDAMGKDLSVFCMNPLDGYSIHCLPMRTRGVFERHVWTIPELGEKDMLVVPLTPHRMVKTDNTGRQMQSGPLCAIFSPIRIEVNKSIADIWD